jgi:hypothetical protein
VPGADPLGRDPDELGGGRSPRAGRAVLAGSAVGLLVVAVLVLGVVLRNRPPPEPQSEPAPTSAPAPDPTPAGAPVPPPPPVPVVEQVQPVDSGGIMVWWRDPAPVPGSIYAYQVYVDAVATSSGNIGKREDGSFRPNQEITEVTRKGGKPEKVDASAHEYCVVVRRLGRENPVDSPAVCIGPRPAAAPR